MVMVLGCYEGLLSYFVSFDCLPYALCITVFHLHYYTSLYSVLRLLSSFCTFNLLLRSLTTAQEFRYMNIALTHQLAMKLIFDKMTATV
ncbi:hypothetical protein BDQ17DRAFT_1349767 [Cyathus striatus]|nr:hypothetical protein BDQ17DRAFT_1349767 [Cyathus striatus]